MLLEQAPPERVLTQGQVLPGRQMPQERVLLPEPELRLLCRLPTGH